MERIQKTNQITHSKQTEMKNAEVIQLKTVNGKLIATVSYQDESVNDLNNGYTTIDIPVNIREIQLSPRGNVLVNQSVCQDSLTLNSNLNEQTASN